MCFINSPSPSSSSSSTGTASGCWPSAAACSSCCSNLQRTTIILDSFPMKVIKKFLIARHRSHNQRDSTVVENPDSTPFNRLTVCPGSTAPPAPSPRPPSRPSFWKETIDNSWLITVTRTQGLVCHRKWSITKCIFVLINR